MSESRDPLQELACACGVAIDYWDYSGVHRVVSDDTLRAVLKAMDIDADTPAQVAASLKMIEERPWRRVLPECIVTRNDDNYWVRVHVPHGKAVTVTMHFEEGGSWDLPQLDVLVAPREINGVLTGEATFNIPPGQPLGWHRLTAQVEGDERPYTCPVAVTPARLGMPNLRGGRAWGVMSQFYANPSGDSWGIGDASDLATICKWVASKGADFLLINPVHASQVSFPLENSPYLPCSRRFWNPIYIRPDAIAEYHKLSEKKRKTIAQLQAKAQSSLSEAMPETHPGISGSGADFFSGDLIKRDPVWKQKLRALEIIYEVPRSKVREADYQEFLEEQGPALEQFATWCALTEKYGLELPEKWQTPDSTQFEKCGGELLQRRDLFKWLQWVCYRQLRQAQQVAVDAGMKIGVMHDLAVGVHQLGADHWSDSKVYAQGISVGAPADMYNQLGQNWSQPPWRPDRLEQQAYEPLRRTVAAAAKMGGALRIDHIMGLLRLWWIPEGMLPKDGTYVRYNHQAMVGVLLLEAYRNNLVVVGEDLGTVEPWVRDYLRYRGILGTGVLFFEFDAPDHLMPPQDYRREQLAAVNTHDMPPVAGYLTGEDLRIREALDLLDSSREDAEANQERVFGAVRRAMIEYAGLAEDERDMGEIISALYRYVAATPAQLVVLTLADAVQGQLTENQPGTEFEYPNWCVPLRDQAGNTRFLEDVTADQFANQLLEMLEKAVHPV